MPLTATELALRADTSRGTLRQLLDGAAAQGWFEAEAPPRRWRLRAKAVRASHHWVALELLWMQGLANAAWQRLALAEAA